MPRKNSLLAVLLVTCVLGTALAVRHRPQRLTVRTSVYDAKPRPAFFSIPHSTCDEGIEEYEKVWQGEDSNLPWDLYCLCNDPRWCLFFDLSGFIVGIQISYLLDDIKHIDKNVYNWSNPNFKDNIIYDTPVKSVPIFFTNPEKLTEAGRNRSRDVVDELWAHLEGKWVRFDCKRHQRYAPVISENFYRQGCVPKIGQIYSRGFHKKGTCQDVFMLYQIFEYGRLIGFGHAIPGIGSTGPRRNIYNHPSGTVLQNTAANPPPCFHELGQYGFTAVIVWTVEDPWNIRCPKRRLQ